MELTLHSEFDFDSCHRLVGYVGKCSNIHGHTWKVDCWFKGDSKYRDKVGILVDFGYVKAVKDFLDHKDLNTIFKTFNPTAENISLYIYKLFKKSLNRHIKIKIRVYETYVGKKTYCEVGDW